MTSPDLEPTRKQHGIRQTLDIALGSLDGRFVYDTPSNREVFRSNVTTETRQPLNDRERVFSETFDLVHTRRLPDLPIDYSKPYWNPERRYSPLEILNTLSQYMDFHAHPLPKTVLPPETDVRKFIERVLSSPSPLLVPQQLDIALDITEEATGKPNLVGAAEIAFAASRHQARGLDKRAYPGIIVGPNELRAWDEKVTHFDEKSGRYDGPGDTYYFWSHFFGATALKAIGGIKSEVFQEILKQGTPLMKFVRAHIAKRPLVTPHQESSVIGRQLGLEVARMVGVNQRPIFSST